MMPRSRRGRRPNGRVGVREMRQNLSVYLDRVKAGETLQVTEYGQVVALLAPLPAQRLTTLETPGARGPRDGAGRLAEESTAAPARRSERPVDPADPG